MDLHWVLFLCIFLFHQSLQTFISGVLPQALECWHGSFHFSYSKGGLRGRLTNFRRDKNVVKNVENEYIYNFSKEKKSEKPNLDLIL